jgi:hypothetical protein
MVSVFVWACAIVKRQSKRIVNKNLITVILEGMKLNKFLPFGQNQLL